MTPSGSCWTIVRAPRECLPHNYIVGMPWLKESREAVESTKTARSG